MVACLPLLLLPPLLLLLLATLGVGSPSFHSPPASQPRLFIERGLGRPQKPLDSFTLGPPLKELFGDFLETSPLLERRTRSSPPHIDPYYRQFIDYIDLRCRKITDNLVSIWRNQNKFWQRDCASFLKVVTYILLSSSHLHPGKM